MELHPTPGEHDTLDDILLVCHISSLLSLYYILIDGRVKTKEEQKGDEPVQIFEVGTTRWQSVAARTKVSDRCAGCRGRDSDTMRGWPRTAVCLTCHELYSQWTDNRLHLVSWRTVASVDTVPASRGREWHGGSHAAQQTVFHLSGGLIIMTTRVRD